MKVIRYHCLLLLLIITFQTGISAQEKAYRPGVLFREDWKEIPAETPIHQGHVSNQDLIIGLYGPGKDSIKKSHHDIPCDDPFYTWSGLCKGNWAVTLKHKSQHMDLSAFSRVRWRSKQSGFRKLHIVLKLADGTWLVSRQGDGASGDWRICEMNLQDIEWYSIDMEFITEQKQISDPDLSNVLEIGYTDLMPGGQSAACSRLDWIEVYGFVYQ